VQALRIMTFNVQLLPWLGSTVSGQTNDAEERAHGAADAIESLPNDDRPHVIAFNEVFDEDGRDVLLSRLSGLYPNYVKKIDDGGVLEDSGLMLFSTLPFHTLPNGDLVHTGFFSASAGDDSLSNKGFGIVQVGAPAEVTTIVFTHAQASYAAEDEHRDVRVKQFDQMRDAIDGVVGSDPNEWRNVILVGDLNVRGDSGAVSDEWTSVVEQAGSTLFERLVDGWRTYMHPPGDLHDHDPGTTNITYGTGLRQRLDYVCTTRTDDVREALVPHHMRVRLRHASDHFALEAVVQRASPRCTPSDALDLLSVMPTGAVQPEWPSEVRAVNLSFPHDGTVQWIWMKRPGTFTVFTQPGLEVDLYAFDDLSAPLDRLDTLHVNELPPTIQGRFGEQTLDPKGGTYVSRSPFFIALRSPAGSRPNAWAVVLEHRGESPATAIRLRLHDDAEAGFPSGQRLGDDDVCWFKATPQPTFAGTSRLEHFVAHNPTGRDIAFASHDTSLQQLAEVSGAQPTLELTVSTSGDETLYFTIRRSDDSMVGFHVHWYSPLSYLVLSEPIGLYVDDESGPDALGDDEVIMSLWMDGASVIRDGRWDDADSGERWPGLADAIRNKLWTQLPGRMRIGFASSMDLSYVEDDFTAAGYQFASLSPLGRSEPVQKERRVNMPVPDGISDGRYTFYCTISKLP
jgi:hypothetical protein